MHIIKQTNNHSKIFLFTLMLSIPLLNGCIENYAKSDTSDKSEKVTIEEKGQKEATKNDDVNAESSGVPKDDLISEEQKVLIENMEEITPEEALKNIKTNEKEVTILDGQNGSLSSKDKFTDLEDFSRYIAELFFQYHAGKISGGEFLKFAEPHLSDSFIEQLPKERAARIDMFDTLQLLFKDALSSPMKDYIVTSANELQTNNTVHFYRKYTLENGTSINYETIAQQVKGQWVLVDDVPITEERINANKIGSAK